MAAPPIVERHKHHFHRQSPIKETVRVATTASITIASDLNVGGTIDGVVLADGDRVLVKDQGTGSQNGIYVAGASPARDYDVSTDDPDVRGSLIYVRDGTANGGKLFRSTNLTLPTIGTTSLVFAEFTGGGGAPTNVDYLVGTASGSLSNEIVVGTTPGGELGGTWASPTIDTTHAGTNHLQPVRKNSAGSVFERRRLNFIEGSNVTLTVADDAGDDEVDVTIAAAGGAGGTVDIEDEGAAEGAADTIDFTGAGVSVTFAAGTATVDIPGGGGGATINDGGLKPGSVTDDFDAAISGWTAHSTGGTFTIASCKHQAVDGSHLRMGFHNQNGQIYKAQANGDFTWQVGGLRAESGNFGLDNPDMFGIAALDSSGNGVGIVFYNDANAILAEIASWGYNTFYSLLSNYGHHSGTGGVERGIYTVKLTRATNTWSGSISVDGENWINFGATGSKTITVDKRAIGIFYNPGNTYRGTLVAAYEDI